MGHYASEMGDQPLDMHPDYGVHRVRDVVMLDENDQYAPDVERVLTDSAVAELRQTTNGPRSE